MIIPKLYGRLGNQCFQIAAAISHSIKMGDSWAIPRRTNDARYWPNYFLNEVPLSNRSHHFTLMQHNEPRHCFDPLPDNKDLTLNGYFQSEKYWPLYDDKYCIGDALGFHKAHSEGYIAIHVRRGDYISQFSEQHPPLPMAYYGEAVDHFLNIGQDRFKIYSDDIKWCKENFLQHYKYKMQCTFEYSRQIDALADMRNMYNATGFIIANSTFSLFPALLRLDNPTVIAPAEHRWYGPANAHLETCDLMPQRFIKI